MVCRSGLAREWIACRSGLAREWIANERIPIASKLAPTSDWHSDIVIASKLAPTSDWHSDIVIASKLAPTRNWDAIAGKPIAGKPAPTILHGADLRKGRYSETGRIYLITTVTEGRARVFEDFWCARLLIKELMVTDGMGWSNTWAFVVMPDHLHWLVGLGETDLSQLVRRIKSCSAIAINRLTGQEGRRLWQKGFHDHALRKEEDLKNVARYVIANPVRAGLVESVRNYPHWDARWL